MAMVRRWGNSLAVRIPAAVAKQLQIKAGMTVDIVAENGVLLVKPRKQKRQHYRLTELLKNCRPHQLHGEIDAGPDVGREVVK